MASRLRRSMAGPGPFWLLRNQPLPSFSPAPRSIGPAYTSSSAQTPRMHYRCGPTSEKRTAYVSGWHKAQQVTVAGRLSLARARVPRTCTRVPARISSRAADGVFCSGSMTNPFETRYLTARKRAYIEEQRMRNVAGAFTRLRRALDNTARPAWGQSTSD
jgi:hypothetical protein